MSGTCSSLLSSCASLLGVVSLGCTWHSANAHHSFGPAFFRYTAPPHGEAYVAQVRHVLLHAEAGDSVGLALGLDERVAASPRAGAGDSEARWTALLAQQPAADGDWVFSPFYLRGEALPTHRFVARRAVGVRLLGGGDGRALTVGYSSFTTLRPLPDELHVFRYDESDPMATVFRSWDATAVPSAVILKEAFE